MTAKVIAMVTVAEKQWWQQCMMTAAMAAIEVMVAAMGDYGSDMSQ